MDVFLKDILLLKLHIYDVLKSLHSCCETQVKAFLHMLDHNIDMVRSDIKVANASGEKLNRIFHCWF